MKTGEKLKRNVFANVAAGLGLIGVGGALATQDSITALEQPSHMTSDIVTGESIIDASIGDITGVALAATGVILLARTFSQQSRNEQNT